MLATMETLAEIDGSGKGAHKDLNWARAKRRRLESHMGPQWDLSLSLQIDACLMEEDRLRHPLERTTIA
jgi:hypothetical protein